MFGFADGERLSASALGLAAGKTSASSTASPSASTATTSLDEPLPAFIAPQQLTTRPPRPCRGPGAGQRRGGRLATDPHGSLRLGVVRSVATMSAHAELAASDPVMAAPDRAPRRALDGDAAQAHAGCRRLRHAPAQRRGPAGLGEGRRGDLRPRRRAVRRRDAGAGGACSRSIRRRCAMPGSRGARSSTCATSPPTSSVASSSSTGSASYPTRR